VIQINEAAGREEGIPDVADGALDAALLVAAGDRDRARLVAIVPGEAQQGGMEADRRAMPLKHGALEIVIEEDTRNALPRGEGSDMAAQEALHSGVQEEAQKDLARVAPWRDALDPDRRRETSPAH